MLADKTSISEDKANAIVGAINAILATEKDEEDHQFEELFAERGVFRRERGGGAARTLWYS